VEREGKEKEGKYTKGGTWWVRAVPLSLALFKSRDILQV
jgi:hypothetical protein